MAKSDRSTVHVDLFVGFLFAQAQRACTRDTDRGEGLIDLDQFEVGDADPLLLDSKIDRIGRLKL